MLAEVIANAVTIDKKCGIIPEPEYNTCIQKYNFPHNINGQYLATIFGLIVGGLTYGIIAIISAKYLKKGSDLK